MKIKPIGNRIVIKTNKAKETNVLGVIIMENEESNSHIGKIVAISNTVSDQEFKLGDLILYAESEASIPETDGVEYLVINTKDILAIVKESEKDND